MNCEELRKAQMIQLNILKEFRRICKENNLNYWLDSGTLLGAVRHGGFIPWDDDLDVGMLRKDYEKFIELARSELSEEFLLQDWYITPNYYFPFAKIRRVGTLWKELQTSDKDGNGIYIDIFPYDIYPDKKIDQIQQHYIVDILKRAIAVKFGDRPWKSLGGINWGRILRYLPVFAVSLFVGSKSKNIFDKIQKRYNSSKKYSCYFPSGTAQYGKYVIPREYLDNLELIQFEDSFFTSPRNAKEYLTIVYGDYMRLPPENERNIGHSIVDFNFGDIL